MPDGFSITLSGDRELLAKFRQIRESVGPEAIEPILSKQADILKARVASNAPRGPTGNLKRGAISKVLRRRKVTSAVVALSAMDFWIAPHAHLVESGTALRWQKSTGRFTGWSPPRPFFKPAYDALKEQILNDLRNEITALIERASQ